MMSVPQIPTKRLLLRGWDDAGRDALAALNADARVMEHFPSTLSREASLAFCDQANRHLAERKFGFWAVELAETREVLGFVGLAEPDFEAQFMPCVEIGWRLKFDAWGHGYASESAAAVLDYAWNELKLHEVVAFTAQGNRRSIRVMEKIGMKHEPDLDFEHPKLPLGHRLSRHFLYKISNKGQ